MNVGHSLRESCAGHGVMERILEFEFCFAKSCPILGKTLSALIKMGFNDL